MYDVMEGDYVSVLEVFQERYLSDGSTGSPFFMLQPDLLEGH